MKISFSSTSKAGSCLVAMISKKGIEKKKPSSFLRLNEFLIQEKIFRAEKNETLFLPCTRVGSFKHLLLVGLGDSEKISHETVRQAAASAYRQLEKYSLPDVEVDVSLCLSFFDNPAILIRAMSEGFILAHYDFNELKQKQKDKKSVKNIFFSGVVPSKEMKTGLAEGRVLADSTNFARWLADNPANLMTPSILAQEVQKKFDGIPNVKVSVWNKDRIKKEKMGGILGVSLGSNQDPRVIIIEYTGNPGDKGGRPLCFVGKGLTFDSGGISIKPSRDMHEMKYDMCGSVAVIGALLAMARLKLKVNVMGLVGSTENMLGAAATKPGDVLKARNGKTMEVLNTDAEGRLVLADILSYTSEQKPEFIVDAATLTGAMRFSLGDVYSGLFTRNQDMEKQLKKASVSSGEEIWSLPLNDFHVQDIKSTVADVANISSTGQAGSSTAAAFLEHFVNKKIPWAHFDIAETAYDVARRLPYCRTKCASGVMVRTFVELARQYVR